MGIMPEDRTRRWSKLFRRYGIPDDAPEATENDREDNAPRDSQDDNPIRKLFPTAPERKPRKKK